MSIFHISILTYQSYVIQSSNSALWGVDNEGNFKQSSIYTPDAPAWYQRENRSDILLSQDLHTCRALTKDELFVLEGPAKHSAVHSTGHTNHGSNAPVDNGLSSTADEKIARIFYLLQRDLLGNPLATMILERKSQRDSFYKDGTVFPDAFNTQIGGFVLGRKSKLCAWLVILLLLVVMVVYILYFALQHPSQLQRAWLYTLYVFLCVDCVVISTLEVLITHVKMPCIIKSDMKIVRNIVEATIETFNHVAQSSADAVRPFNTSGNPSTTNNNNNSTNLTIGTGHHHTTGRQMNSRMLRSLQNQLAEDDAAVPNITEFFFVSSRLSMYFSDLPEAKLALTYATMLPPGTLFPKSWYRPRHGQSTESRGDSDASNDANTSRLTTPASERNRNYKTIFSCASFAKVFVNLFQSYAFCSAPTQDLLLQMMLVLVCGILALISFELYKMLPYLVVAPAAAVIGLYFVIRLVMYMCRAGTRTARALSQRRVPPTNLTSNPSNNASNHDPINTDTNDATPPASATHLKPSRAATLEAQRRALINNSAIKRNRVAPNPQLSPTPLAQPDPNAKFSAPRVSPKGAQSQGFVRSFMDDSSSSSEGKSEDENSVSEDAKSVQEEKLDLENVV